jgi:hypothetical protein
MNKVSIARLLAPIAALGAMACMQENPVERSAADGGKAGNELAVSARSPVGSTEPVQFISTLAQLRAMTTTGNYRLINEIDASSTSGNPFVPIGFVKDPFHGTFDGNNFAIRNLTIRGAGNNIGMFSWAVNANLRSIRLVNVNVVGGHSVGAIAGFVRNVDLTNSFVTGTVTGNLNSDSRVGMLVGEASDFVRIGHSWASGSVLGWARYAGGIAGYVDAYGTNPAAEDYRASFTDVFANVNVNPTMPAAGSVYSGGLAGYVMGAYIERVHTMGRVTGRNAAGGILGYVVNNDPGSTLTYLRSSMTRSVVTDMAAAGRSGTIGNSVGNFSACVTFWDKTVDPGVLNPAMPLPACQVGKTSVELKSPHPDPAKLISPYIYGDVITQAMINLGKYPQCKLGSGTLGDWGFGTCGTEPAWALNTSGEYNTLTHLPTPEAQPKL